MKRMVGLSTLIVASVATAFGAGAPAAFAQSDAKLVAEEKLVTIEGRELGSHTFERAGRTVECEEARFHGEAENGDTTLILLPTYGKCASPFFGGPATIVRNGCSYVLHLTAEAEGEEHSYTAGFDISCPEGKEMIVSIFTSEENHENNTPTCRYMIGAQTGLGTITLTNLAADEEGTKNEWIHASINIEGIVSTRDTTVGKPLLCGAAEDVNGTWSGTEALKGKNTSAEGIDITVATD